MQFGSGEELEPRRCVGMFDRVPSGKLEPDEDTMYPVFGFTLT